MEAKHLHLDLVLHDKVTRFKVYVSYKVYTAAFQGRQLFHFIDVVSLRIRLFIYNFIESDLFQGSLFSQINQCTYYPNGLLS